MLTCRIEHVDRLNFRSKDKLSSSSSADAGHAQAHAHWHKK